MATQRKIEEADTHGKEESKPQSQPVGNDMEWAQLNYRPGSIKDQIVRYLAAKNLHKWNAEDRISLEELQTFAEMLDIVRYAQGDFPTELRAFLARLDGNDE